MKRSRTRLARHVVDPGKPAFRLEGAGRIFTSSKAAMRVGSSTYKIGPPPKPEEQAEDTRKSYDAWAEGCKSYMYNFQKRRQGETIVKANRKEYQRHHHHPQDGGHRCRPESRPFLPPWSGCTAKDTEIRHHLHLPLGKQGPRVKSRRNKVTSITIF